MRKTKIVCTLGPATDREGVLEKLVECGMNVARCNFSHGSYEEHKGRMDRLKAAREAAGKPVGLLLDTKGPEVRVKTFENGKVELKEGQEFILYSDDQPGTEKGVSLTYGTLYSDVSAGTRILFDDGLIESIVVKLQGKDIVCKILNGGVLSNNKGVNVPDAHLSMPYISPKDKQDILFGIEQDVDFIAASFVRTEADVLQIRTILQQNGGENISIIAKIENREGVENIDAIIRSADGVMVARGDMGVEIPGEDVPVIQKMIIKKATEAGKQVITATQMLDSMMKNPRPTRAETADVANAIYDGTSAIMLSGETAAGNYPIQSLQTMVRIAERIEGDIDYAKRFFNKARKANPDVTDAICHATCTTAHDLNAKAILTVTQSGRSARMISRYRPDCDIIGCATNEKVCRQMNLYWGVSPLLVRQKQEVFGLFEHAISNAEQEGYLQKGDVTVVTSGVPIGVSGTTNMLKVQIVE
ncbi:MAG: pyruvate kinase [Lachnospiraceae bacterium]|nr:pyruvate kinase [Lachnospiraceae bacterium]